MSDDKPLGKVNKNVGADVPITSDGTLVNDPVVVVDSTSALSGGEVSVNPPTETGVDTTVPRLQIRING